MTDSEQSLVLLIVARLKNPRYLSPTLGIVGALLLFLGVFSPIVAISSGFGVSSNAMTGVAVGANVWMTNSILALVVASLCLLGYKKHFGVIAAGVLILVLTVMFGYMIGNARTTGMFGDQIVPGIRWWGWLFLAAGAILIIASGTIGTLASLRTAKPSDKYVLPLAEAVNLQFKWTSYFWPCLGLAGVLLLFAGVFTPIQLLHTPNWPVPGSWNLIEADGWKAAGILALAGISGFLFGYRRFYEVVATGVCLLGLILIRLGQFIAEYNVMVAGIAKANQFNEQIVKNRESVIDGLTGEVIKSSEAVWPPLQVVGSIDWSISWPGWCVLVSGACLVILAGVGEIYSSSPSNQYAEAPLS